MKKTTCALFVIFLQLSLLSQGLLPKTIDADNSLLTIAHYSPSNCGFVNSNSSYRYSDDYESLVEVMDSIGAYDLGSGFIYEFKGGKYVITCEHVILGSDSIVAYDMQYNAYDLELVGGDTFYDVAVLKFKNPTDNKKWKGISFDFTPQEDAEVHAVGYWNWNGTLNYGSGHLTNDNMTITNRQLPVIKIGFMTSNAPSQSGYSGGALLNSEGQVIGMNTMVHTQEENSYALNSATIKSIIHNIANHQSKDLTRPFMGIQFSQHMDGGRVIMDNILDNSPAAKYRDKLKGKLLVSIAGQKVNEIYDVLKTMEASTLGKSIILEYEDNNSTSTLELVPDILSDMHHEAIARHAVQDNTEDDIVDIEMINGSVYIHTNRQNPEMAMTAGLKKDRVYCIDNLVDLGTLVRIFSLHGELRIGLDETLTIGRWIRFSESDDKRVLYN